MNNETPTGNIDNIDTKTGIIAWFTRNHVAANLLMAFIIIAGLATTLTSARKQMFPQIEFNSISISAAYPGAAPADIEEGVALRIEDALEEVQGLDRVITYSRRNSFSAHIEVDETYDLQEVMDEIKVQIDGIVSFPAGMERPIITARKYRQEVLYITVFGDLEYKQLREFGRSIHKEIQSLPIVNVSNFFGGLRPEISIEISKDKLREYNLTFNEVANAVRQHSTNSSAGQIKATDGYITLRAEQQAYLDYEFSAIPVRTLPDGSKILLGNLGTITDGFEDGVLHSKFNGQNAFTIFVGASASQSITEIAEVVNQYIDDKNQSLPAGIAIETWVDMTYYLKGRLDMMIKNMIYGGILVFLILSLFLKIRLAFWVMLGLPIAFFGALLFMPTPWVDVTINVASLFGFIMVLGIVVDDAIVIGESVNSEIERYGQSVDNVIRGAKRVAMPATFGVLTTIAAFSPFVLSSGPSAAIPNAIGSVVVLCLLFSLVESKLILPAHLAGMKARPLNLNNPINRFRNTSDQGLKWIIKNRYEPLLEKGLAYRYFILTIFIAVGLLCMGLFKGDVIQNIGFPKVPHDFPRVAIEMEETSSEANTLENLKRVEHTINWVDQQIENEFGSPMIDVVNVNMESRTKAEITAKLVDPDDRPIDTFQLAERWRNALPELPGVKAIAIQEDLTGASTRRDDGDIAFRFSGPDLDQLELAISEIKARLKEIKGVGDVNDSRDTAVEEIQFELKPLAYTLGLTTAEIASQMNFSFYGMEAQRILRDGEELKVMLRYPASERNSPGEVESILIIAPNGAEVPLSELAELNVVQRANVIRREDGKQTISLWANINRQIVTPTKVYVEMNREIIPEILKNYPGITSKVTGSYKRDQESNDQLYRDAIITLLVIYILLAIPLRSYFQPLIIMSVIPFGIIGAVIGHLILGMNMSQLSTFGMIAASGVVINDSLVMVDYINNHRKQGIPIFQAVVQAGVRRFRAIVLTSLTTFIGLIPIIMETSLQAKIVIPMAVSLAFGVLFATVVTLFLVPCLYLIGRDLSELALKFWHMLLALWDRQKTSA